MYGLGTYLVGTIVSSPTIEILSSSSSGGLLAFTIPSYVSARLVCFLCSVLLDDAFTIGRDGCSDDIVVDMVCEGGLREGEQ